MWDFPRAAYPQVFYLLPAIEVVAEMQDVPNPLGDSQGSGFIGIPTPARL